MEKVLMNENHTVSISTDKDETMMISEPCRKHECKSHVFALEFLEQLQINTDVLCPQCGSEFAHESALNLHIEKVHHLKVQKNFDEYTKTKSLSKLDKEREQCKCQYFCSVDGCKFNVNSARKRSLPTFHSLKNHFVRIHGARRFYCRKPECGRKFSIKSEMERHEKNCGINFSCKSCDRKYATSQSLKKHQMKKHADMANNELEIETNEIHPSTSALFQFDFQNLTAFYYAILKFYQNELKTD